MKSSVGDLGDMGENIFSFWCSEAGLIANPSKIDKAGWDFFVDFPFCSGVGASEVHKAAATCQVQVKATRGNDKAVKVKLSNLRRMATSQAPSFFVFVEFDEAGGVLGCYVVHIGEELIRRVVERIYFLDAKGETMDLNRRKMVVRYDERNKLKAANGEEVKRRFIEDIGGDVAEYIAWKKNFLQSVGFEDGHAEFYFKIDDDGLKNFMIMSLGLKKEVHVNDFSGFEKRFGVLRKEPFVDGGSGVIELRGVEPHSKGRLVVKEDKLSPGLSLDIDIYFSSIYSLTPDCFKAFRVSHQFFDAIFYPFANKVDFSFSIDNEGSYIVAQFCDYLRFIEIISSPSKKTYLEVLSEDSSILGFYLSEEDGIEAVDNDLEAFEACESLFEYFGIEKEAKVRAGEVIGNGERIKEINNILTKEGVIRVDFPEGQELLESGLPIAYVFQIGTKIGEYRIGAYAAVFGDVEPLNEVQCRLYSRKLSVEKKLVVRPGVTVASEDLESVKQEVIDKYDEDYLVVVADVE